MSKDNRFIIPVSFITAALLAAVIFVVSGIYLGSERTLLIFDMKEQFVSFYSFMSRIRSLSDLTYTFEGSLGTPIAGLIAYYLASPVSLLYLFFDVTHLPDAIALVDIIKAGFIGASFAYFALHKGVKEPVKIVILSTCYALSSAAVTFFILPMYLDTLFWLPLIAIRLEMLVLCDDKNKTLRLGLIYSILLFLCILIHYYSAYMVCLFLILYVVYVLSAGIDFRKIFAVRFLRFVLFSLIGSGAAGFLLMPALRELMRGKVYDAGVYSNGKLLVAGPLVIFKQLICGSFGGLYSEGGPAVYCTLICISLAAYGLYKKKSNKAYLAVSIIITAVFIGSFMFRPMYRIWHMFRDPVAYPHRFSFLFVFFVMVLATEGVKEINAKILHQRILFAAVCILLVFNGYRQINMDLKTLPSATRSDYRLFIDTTADLVHTAQDEGRGSLCRISKDYEFSSNDCLLLGYNGLDYFSSSYDPGVLRLYKKLGLLQYHYKACDEGTTILTDMFFGIDYMIHKGHADNGYEYMTSNGFATLSRNPYSLGAGYLTGIEVHSDVAPDFGNNPFENQNLFVNGILGYDAELLKPLEFKEVISDVTGLSGEVGEGGELLTEQQINREITFIAPAGKNVYLNFELLNESDLDYETKSDSDLIIVTEGDRVIAVFSGYQKAYNILLGCYDEDTKITLNIEGTKDYREAFIYAMDIGDMKPVYDKLCSCGFKIDSLESNRIEGRISADESGRNLILTIPYSEDIKVCVDGKYADTCTYAGTLMMVPGIEAGEHRVVIEL